MSQMRGGVLLVFEQQEGVSGLLASILDSGAVCDLG